jgi:hypothetical protein
MEEISIRPGSYPDYARIERYLQQQKEIRDIIQSDSSSKDEYIDDIICFFENLSKSPAWINIITFGIIPVKKYFKRKKMKKVIENLLIKIFDISLGWYAMDYEDLRETCNVIGGRDYFNRDDHRHIYISVREKLRVGPIRGKCIELGIVNYLNEKITDIYDNFLKFKSSEL